MLVDVLISPAAAQSFVLTLARVGGVFVFVPLPGSRTGPAFVRLVISVALTLALYSKWPAAAMAEPSAGELLLWGLGELSLGVCVGLLISFLTETFAFGAQVLSMPAGYTYATAIDPGTQAESNILISLAQLLSGLLFFAFDLHHQVLLALARSFDHFPPGAFALNVHIAEVVIRAGGTMLSLGFSLVLPILTVLVMVDIAMALLGRLNAQVQVMTVSFPAKMLASMVLLTLLGGVLPALFRKVAGEVLPLMWQILLS